MRPAHRFTIDNALWRLVALHKHTVDHPAPSSSETDAAETTETAETAVNAKVSRARGPGSMIKQNVDNMLRGGLKWNRPLPAGKAAELDTAVEELVAAGEEWSESVERIRKAAEGLQEGTERLVVSPSA